MCEKRMELEERLCRLMGYVELLRIVGYAGPARELLDEAEDCLASLTGKRPAGRIEEFGVEWRLP